jgi:hypothetical protein
MPDKCYFVSYMTLQPVVGSIYPAQWRPREALLHGEHPLAALARWRANERERQQRYREALLDKTSTLSCIKPDSEDFCLLSWNEITVEEYEQYHKSR